MTPAAKRILLGIALSSLGSGLTMPLLVVYLGQVRGLGTTIAGLVVAFTAVGSLVLFMVVGTAGDKYGPKPVLMGGLVVEAIAVFLLSQVTTSTAAFGVAAFMAIGGSMIWPSQSALIGRVSDPGERERVFGIQFMLLNLGLGIGGLVSAVLVRHTSVSTFQLLYILDALTYLLYLAVVVFALTGIGVGPEAVGKDHDSEGIGGFREVLQDRLLQRVLVLAVVLLMSGYGALEVGMPVFITVVNHASVSWVGVEYAVNTFTIVSAQLWILRMIKGRSRSYLMLTVAVIWAMSWVLTGTSLLVPAHASVLLLVVACGVFALGEAVWAPVAPSLVNDLAPPRLRARYNSTIALVWSLSSIIGPGIAGIMLGAGLYWAWILVLIAGCALAGMLAVGLHRRLSPVLDGRVQSPASGPAASE